jgi:hypothetical protein
VLQRLLLENPGEGFITSIAGRQTSAAILGGGPSPPASVTFAFKASFEDRAKAVLHEDYNIKTSVHRRRASVVQAKPTGPGRANRTLGPVPDGWRWDGLGFAFPACTSSGLPELIVCKRTDISRQLNKPKPFSISHILRKESDPLCEFAYLERYVGANGKICIVMIIRF